MKRSKLILLVGILLITGCTQKVEETTQKQSEKMTEMMTFVKEGKIEDVKRELANGFPINSKVAVSTLLTGATLQQNVEMVNFLLENNADPNLQNSLGDTALIYAGKKGNMDIIKLLLEHGADSNITNNNGKNSLFGAAGFGHIKVVKLLLDKGANAKAKTKENYTTLMSAELHPKIIALLIKHNPDINAKFYGDTVLIRSTSQGTYETVKILLENNAEINIKDEKGRTALDHANMRRDKKLIELIKKHGGKKGKEL